MIESKRNKIIKFLKTLGFEPVSHVTSRIQIFTEPEELTIVKIETRVK